jgi:hypothetical protein
MAQKDLLDQIEFASLECLNQSPSQPVANAIKQGYREDDGLFLESDTDEQLLINVPFQQAVKLASIVIKGPSDSGPKSIKLYTNRPSMGFSDIGSVPVAQEFSVSPSQLSGEPIPLKFVKFQGVTLLTIFIENNQADEETTKVFKIAFHGNSGETMNVAEIKKQEEK